MTWALLPLALQALCMLVDELHFHRARRLPRWERIGHPIDTLSVLACWGFTLSIAPGTAALRLYVVLAAASCLLVTKDELVHAQLCPPLEHWLHALLFVLHPIVLGTVAWSWLNQERTLLWLGASTSAAFCLYQAVYWNVPWRIPSRPRSTTLSTTSSAIAGTPLRTTPSPSCVRNPASETRG